MEHIRLEDFCPGNVFDEDTFKKSLEKHDWDKYKDKAVLIYGCAAFLVPPWAYLFIAGKLFGKAMMIMYGEPKSPFIIYKR